MLAIATANIVMAIAILKLPSVDVHQSPSMGVILCLPVPPNEEKRGDVGLCPSLLPASIPRRDNIN